MIGLPGSGKSGIVDKEFVGKYQVVCLDDIRLALGSIYNKRAEPFVRSIAVTMVRAYMERGLSIVVDSTCTSERIVKDWKALADEYNYRMEGVQVNTSIEICKKRKLGVNKLTDEVFDKMEKQLKEWIGSWDNYFNFLRTTRSLPSCPPPPPKRKIREGVKIL